MVLAVFPTGWARLLKTPGAQGLGLQRSKNPGRCTTRLWLVRGGRVRLGRPWRNGTTALGGGAWFDFNADAVRRDGRPSMRTLFDRFCEIGHRQVLTIVRAGSPGLFARANRRCLARASFSFLQLRPRLFIRRLAPAFGRFEHRLGFAARRAGVDVTPFRSFEAIPREIALGRNHCGVLRPAADIFARTASVDDHQKARIFAQRRCGT